MCAIAPQGYILSQHCGNLMEPAIAILILACIDQTVGMPLGVHWAWHSMSLALMFRRSESLHLKSLTDVFIIPQHELWLLFSN